MRNIQNIVEEYVSKETDYAIQIVGNWGTGKTFFYRNSLQKLISNTPTFIDNRKNYKPIYISLFGIKSSEDIATKVVLELYQSTSFLKYFRRKHLRITQGIFKIGFRGFLNFRRLGNINDYLTDIKSIGKDVLNESEIVICFDDLERIDSDFNFSDLMGYINSLVDEKIKVLILANEDVLLKNSDSDYRKLKEKIIGISVPFPINTEDTIRSIIKTRYSSFQVYSDFLLKHIDVLIKISNSAENNYRHLIYALDSFHKCHSLIHTDVITAKHEIKSKVEDYFGHLLKSTLALAIEYKSSSIKFEDMVSFNGEVISIASIIERGYSSTQDTTIDETNEDSKFGFEQFSKKYNIVKRDFKLFETVFAFVTGHNEFQIEKFILEFKSLFHLDNGSVLPQYVVLNSLGYGDCFALSEDEYDTKTKAMIEFAEEGKYLPSEYLTVMYYSERFDNLLDMDLDEVKGRIIRGLKISISTFSKENSHEFTRFQMSGHSDLSERNKDVFEIGKLEIINVKKERELDAKSKTWKLLMEEPEKFIAQYYDDGNFQDRVRNSNVFAHLSVHEFMSFIKESKNKTLFDLNEFFKERIEESGNLKDEVDKLKELNQLLKNYADTLTSSETRMKKYLITQLIGLFDIKVLGRIESRL